MDNIFLNEVVFDIKGLKQQQTQQSILIKGLASQLSKKIDIWIEQTLETKTKLKRPYTSKQLKRHKIQLVEYIKMDFNEVHYYELKRKGIALSTLNLEPFQIFKSNES